MKFELLVQGRKTPPAFPLKPIQAFIHLVSPLGCGSHGSPELFPPLVAFLEPYLMFADGVGVLLNSIFLFGQPALVASNGLLNRLVVQATPLVGSLSHTPQA